MRKRTKARFDILGQIRYECIRRGWNDYTLSKYSGIPHSTISSWFSKNQQPTLATIEKLCDAFGITLSEFFQKQEEETKYPDVKNIRERINPDFWYHLVHMFASYEKAAALAGEAAPLKDVPAGNSPKENSLKKKTPADK